MPSTSDPPKDPFTSSPIISALGRLFAIASAIVCCFLLYRFAKGFWHNYTRPGGRRILDRRTFYGRKHDVLYSRVGIADEFYDDDDEDEGYHDQESAPAVVTPKVWLDRPLPDKPLPPLPLADAP